MGPLNLRSLSGAGDVAVATAASADLLCVGFNGSWSRVLGLECLGSAFWAEGSVNPTKSDGTGLKHSRLKPSENLRTRVQGLSLP